MTLKYLFSIKTKPGLFLALNQVNGGFVAQSIVDGHKEKVVKGSAEAYCLADIELYSKEGLVPLKKVFQLMKTNPQPPVNEKEHTDQIKAYFHSLLPDLDTKKVFPSDMRKIITWFKLLDGKVNFGIS